ncbi:hypothetical protein C7B69_15615 [filamentous cyanobacterium Phorm 46]|nr:hypothetical protein C7B69_15615 [filamentous cyanobacterium Phorm 46]
MFWVGNLAAVRSNIATARRRTVIERIEVKGRSDKRPALGSVTVRVLTTLATAIQLQKERIFDRPT